MDDQDLKKIRAVIQEELKPLATDVGSLKTELGLVKKRVDDLWEQTEKVSVNIEEIKESLESQSSATRHTNGNVDRLDKRLTQVEEQHGIVSPPELVLIS